jgi:hypothetical protein
MVYVAYGSYADTDPYHGWVLGFNATNLAQSANYVFNTTPNATVAAFGVNAGEGALWMGGNGLCVDANNNLYFETANGSFSANTNGGDYSDSFVKLSTTNGLAVADYFTPTTKPPWPRTTRTWDRAGRSCCRIRWAARRIRTSCRVRQRRNPPSGGSRQHGTFQRGQRQSNRAGSARGHHRRLEHARLLQQSDLLSRLRRRDERVLHQQRRHYPTPVSEATTSFSALGGTPSISANGTNNAIVWTIQSDGRQQRAGVLHAYNATNLAQELYNSSQNLARDNPGGSDQNDHANRGQRQGLSSARNMPFPFLATAFSWPRR